jgi:hypothetical protein
MKTNNQYIQDAAEQVQKNHFYGQPHVLLAKINKLQDQVTELLGKDLPGAAPEPSTDEKAAADKVAADKAAADKVAADKAAAEKAAAAKVAAPEIAL